MKRGQVLAHRFISVSHTWNFFKTTMVAELAPKILTNLSQYSARENPGNPVGVGNCFGVLVDQKRFQDSCPVTEVAQSLDPNAGNYRQLLEELNKLEANANKGN